MLEEADESELWIELLRDAWPEIGSKMHEALFQEAGELVAIFSASHRTVKRNLAARKAEKRKARQRDSARA